MSNCGIDAVKFDRLDAPFAELVLCAVIWPLLIAPRIVDLFRPVAFAAVASV